MAEYIDREAFKKSVEERYCKPCKAEKKDHNGCWCRACWVDDMLDEVECFQPADVAPVVRCEDCRFCGFCGEATNLEVMGFYGFCSRGKRKDGGDNDAAD